MVELFLAAALNIQGDWFKPCELTEKSSSIHEELSIVADQWVRRTHSNSKPDCSGQDLLTEHRVYKAIAREPDLDLKVIAHLYEPRTIEAAALLAATQFCGLTHWQAKVKTNVTGLQCAETQIPKKDEVICSTFRLHPRKPRDLLWIGEATPNATGTSPENRHLVFELFAFEREESGTSTQSQKIRRLETGGSSKIEN